MYKKKRGSLELSVNAIVVLVLAITMLGLGIAFTKGKFAELGKRIEIPEPDIPATADDPISLPAKEIDISTKKDTVFSVNIYNDGDLPTTGVDPQFSCVCDNNAISIASSAQVIPSGEDRMFKYIVKAEDITAGTTACTCTISVSDASSNVVASRQINLKVQ